MDVNTILRSHGVGVGKRLVGDAQPEHVLEGKTFSNEDSNELTGSMPNQGGVVLTPGQSNITIPKGYHDGTGRVNAVSFDASKVLTGTTIAGKSGTMPNQGQKIYTPGTSNITIPAGYHDGTGRINGDSNLVAGNIKKGVTIFGVSGNLSTNQPKCLFWYGTQYVNWVPGYVENVASPNISIGNALSMSAGSMGDQSGYFEIGIVTDSPIDLTNIDRIGIDCDGRYGDGYIIVSTSKMGNTSTYNRRRVFDLGNSSTPPGPQILDVSGLNGNYYIRFHGRDSWSSYNLSWSVFMVTTWCV